MAENPFGRHLSPDNPFGRGLAATTAPARPSSAPPTTLQELLNSPGTRLAKDMVIDPAMNLLTVAGKLGSDVISGFGLAPNSVSDFLWKGGDLQRAVDAPFDAANAAARNTPGYAAARTDADSLRGEHGLGIWGQVAGPLLPGAEGAGAALLQAGGNIARSVMGKPSKATTADAANAAMDASAGALWRYQQEHPVLSMGASLVPALASAGTAAVPVLARGAKAAATLSVPALESAIAGMRNSATTAFRDFAKVGGKKSADSFKTLVDGIRAHTTADGTHIFGDAYDAGSFPGTARVLGRLDREAEAGQPLSYEKLKDIRELASDTAASRSLDPKDKMRVHTIKNALDRYIADTDPSHLEIGGVAPDPALLGRLPEARQMWSQQAQASEILRIIKKAENDAKAVNAQSGFEQALRRRFKTLANDNIEHRFLSPDMAKAVQAVVDGAPFDNFLRNFAGRFAPHGTLPLYAHAGAISAGAGTGYEYGGPVGAVAGGGLAAVPGLAGEIARRAATRATVSRASGAVSTALGGGRRPLSVGPALTPNFHDLLRTLILATPAVQQRQ